MSLYLVGNCKISYRDRCVLDKFEVLVRRNMLAEDPKYQAPQKLRRLLADYFDSVVGRCVFRVSPALCRLGY